MIADGSASFNIEAQIMAKKSSPFLLDEEFIGVQPSLVRALKGKIADAVVIQYLHYWLRLSNNHHDEHVWVYNTYKGWSERLGITPRQAERILTRLEDEGVVFACKPNAPDGDHTKWYRINYSHECLTSISPNGEIESTNPGDPESTISGDLRIHQTVDSSSYPERTTESTPPDPSRSPSEPEEEITDSNDLANMSSGSVVSESTDQGAAVSHPPAITPVSLPPAISDCDGTEPIRLDGIADDHSTSREEVPEDHPTGRPAPTWRETTPPEAIELCHALADAIHARGNKRPNPDTKQWYDSARLLLTTDGPDGKGWPYAKALRLLEWCQNDDFWAPNIRSMPKFRKQYDQLREKANADHRKAAAKAASETPDEGEAWMARTS